MTERPFAITLDVGTSRANKTGAWRTERPVYTHRQAPCAAFTQHRSWRQFTIAAVLAQRCERKNSGGLRS